MRRKRSLRLLISAGPTREPIDPVRFLSNCSTGYMGSQLAEEGLRRGHRVTVVAGPGVRSLPRGARVISVVRAVEMERVLRRQAPRADAVIMAAAVSDFRPVRQAPVKLKRQGRLTLTLSPTPDILSRLPRADRQVRVGFALESGRVVARAARKLREKRVDFLLAQQVSRRTNPFGRSPVRAWLLGRSGAVTDLGRRSKLAVARALLDKIEALWYGQPEPHRDFHAART